MLTVLLSSLLGKRTESISVMGRGGAHFVDSDAPNDKLTISLTAGSLELTMCSRRWESGILHIPRVMQIELRML